MYLVKTPWWLKKVYNASLTWKIHTRQNEIFITFDDGPHPQITPFVLDCLKQFDAKATFFCIGKNVKEFPAIYEQLISAGHSVGNHTYHHLNGWKTENSEYFENIDLATRYINSTLFRPPYGRISKRQATQLQPRFNIIMWDVLSGDFDVNLSPEKCLKNVTANTVPGSIIVFHDSEKAQTRLEYVLPKALQYFAKKGYFMRAIEYR